MTLYLIRHAKPAISEYKGFPGPSLGEEGQEQASMIAEYLKDKNIRQVLASDYKRVKETMKPFLLLHPHLNVKEHIALREREKEAESHDSLVNRVQDWFRVNQDMILQQNTAIFSHCGPINMILDYLDPEKTIFKYPHEDVWGCHTPLGKIWAMEWTDTFVTGNLIEMIS
ncbi:MAG: phosphoglycerate mutase family protein [Aureispira sp.]